MPEYLAPGVYVEEIDTGSKPIEGVSTSTAGMVGVTERGPANVPILITSFGEFTRWFGGYLNPADFGEHCYLPHATEGFFTNGGKRLFVTRVLNDSAVNAATRLFDRGTPGSANAVDTQQLVRSGRGSSTIYLRENAPGLSAAPLPTLRIGDGSEAEYRTLTAAPVTANANHVSLRLPLAAAHTNGTAIQRLNPPPAATGTAFDLTNDVRAGDIRISVNNVSGLSAGDLLQLGVDPNDDEYVFVDSTNVATNVVTLRGPLMLDHPAAANGVQLMTAGTPVNATILNDGSLANDTLLFVPVVDHPNYTTAQDFIFINDGDDSEVRRLGSLGTLTLAAAAYADYPQGTLVEAVTLADTVAPNTNKVTTAESHIGSNLLLLDDRQKLNVGDVVRIGATNDPDVEYVTIQSIPNRSAGSDTGAIVINTPLQRDHVSGVTVRSQTVQRSAPSPTALATATRRNSLGLVVGGSNAFAANNTIRITAGGTPYYHRISNTAALTPVPVVLDAPLDLAHPAGAAVGNHGTLLNVQALDPGAWGNRLRVTTRDQDPPLLRTGIHNSAIDGVLGIQDSLHIRLDSASGVEPGTILQRFDAAGQPLGTPFKVILIDRQANNLLTLAQALPAGATEGDRIRSVEFQINVLLLRQPDPAVPLRSENVLAEEAFRYLSMDPRHSRYVHKIIGTTWSSAPGTTADDDGRPLRLEDRRSEGESHYLRVRDTATTAAVRESIRPGPDLLIDTLPDGRVRAARRRLGGGDDSVATITDDSYIGVDNTEPLQRTGLFSLRNEEEISVVACPGRTSARLQGAMIDHCELMRYRFAVLDAQRPPRDSLSDVQAQRQQFDTKNAALYHPWPLIPDPFPTNLAEVADYPIPPSGHVVGIYARTDIERGVHKAPANEVVRGVIGLKRLLNKGEHDILNPYPVNINVIRDFRPNNRGIRVWGGRVITSDPDWKYVNVRRLLIYIEASIDRGLQWVVFEPNAEPLWARVNSSVSNFLRSVWRDGGLEGTKPEEAYFVKVDRTTMTQTDIDNGKLIVVIGVAPVKPAEFVIIRIGLWTAHADS